MFKLVDFLHKKKTKDSPKAAGRKVSAPSTLQRPPPALKLNRREKAEIRTTLRGFQNSPAHEILMKQLDEHNMRDLVEEEAETEDSDEAYSSGTFCVKSLGGDSTDPSEEEGEEDSGNNFGTFCVNSMGGDDGKEDDTPSPVPAFLSHSTSSESPKRGKSKKGKVNVGGSAPDFSAMFREPEDWEKCILSLEKGEWTDKMEQKGAFKRWKKERPAMPSAYMKSSPLSGDMFSPPP